MRTSKKGAAMSRGLEKELEQQHDVVEDALEESIESTLDRLEHKILTAALNPSLPSAQLTRQDHRDLVRCLKTSLRRSSSSPDLRSDLVTSSRILARIRHEAACESSSASTSDSDESTDEFPRFGLNRNPSELIVQSANQLVGSGQNAAHRIDPLLQKADELESTIVHAGSVQVGDGDLEAATPADTGEGTYLLAGAGRTPRKLLAAKSFLLISRSLLDFNGVLTQIHSHVLRMQPGTRSASLITGGSLSIFGALQSAAACGQLLADWKAQPHHSSGELKRTRLVTEVIVPLLNVFSGIAIAASPTIPLPVSQNARILSAGLDSWRFVAALQTRRREGKLRSGSDPQKTLVPLAGIACDISSIANTALTFESVHKTLAQYEALDEAVNIFDYIIIGITFIVLLFYLWYEIIKPSRPYWPALRRT
jgi:hypothetical protein